MCRTLRRFAGLILAFLIPSLPRILAQTNIGTHVMEMRDEIPPEKLPPPVRIPGIGNAHLEITAAPEAQVWFDQGLNLLHDYWDYESARAFEQGVRVDSQCAMCFWGLYEAESFYHSTTRGLAGNALRRAVELQDHASAHERLYIEAAAAREKAMHDPQSGAALRRGAAITGETCQGLSPGRAGQNLPCERRWQGLACSARRGVEGLSGGFGSQSLRTYTGWRRRTIRRKRSAAPKYWACIAPGSGHMVHMPGHIFFRLGDYARAEKAFAAFATKSLTSATCTSSTSTQTMHWNYVHNLMYFVADLLEEGKFEQATRMSNKITGARGKLEFHALHRVTPRFHFAPRSAAASRTAHSRFSACAETAED